jgi:hypothetical protein
VSNADALEWGLATLAVWRVTHLLWAEDGPGDLFARLRHLAGSGHIGRLLDCFYCLSLWIALPFAAWLAAGWIGGIIGWLALSGGACLLERATAPRAAVVEDEHQPPKEQGS